MPALVFAHRRERPIGLLGRRNDQRNVTFHAGNGTKLRFIVMVFQRRRLRRVLDTGRRANPCSDPLSPPRSRGFLEKIRSHHNRLAACPFHRITDVFTITAPALFRFHLSWEQGHFFRRCPRAGFRMPPARGHAETNAVSPRGKTFAFEPIIYPLL
jgi:hypothetical protein